MPTRNGLTRSLVLYVIWLTDVAPVLREDPAVSFHLISLGQPVGARSPSCPHHLKVLQHQVRLGCFEVEDVTYRSNSLVPPSTRLLPPF